MEVHIIAEFDEVLLDGVCDEAGYMDEVISKIEAHLQELGFFDFIISLTQE